MGISRSCYNPMAMLLPESVAKKFQFPMGISRSCYEHRFELLVGKRVEVFQFPMGISRSCYEPCRVIWQVHVYGFNSRWELAGVATTQNLSNGRSCFMVSIPDGN